MFGVFAAELHCSDEECAEVIEAIGDLDDLELLACECGCTLQITAVWEVREQRITPAAELPLAA